MSRHPPPQPGHPRAGKRKLLQGWPWEIRLTALAAIYLGLPALLVVVGALAYFTVRLPDPTTLRAKERAPMVRVLARDGTLLGQRGGGDVHVPVDLLPGHLIDAVIATEDRRFFKHWGVDPAGLLRAALDNLRRRRLAQGGSTLTQQLAKNLFLGPERTFGRKLEELLLALWLEARLGKRDILELYLNRVYLGGGAYGVEGAAQRFFGKSARHLTVLEAAALAGLLKAPSRYSPALNPQVTRARALGVLAKMVDAGLLSEREADEAGRATLRFVTAPPAGRGGADYAVDAVLEALPELVGAGHGDLEVETTIDGPLQRRAQALVTETMASHGPAARAGQAALVLMDPDGRVRALVGGRAWAESQYNRALKARRQPGSAFKPFVYLAALESGLTPDSTVHDLPILGAGWSPRNDAGGYHGAVTLRDALAQSMNAAAARLGMRVGAQRIAGVAHRLGIRSKLRTDASLALGTSEVTLIELAGAYGVLAAGGLSVDPHLVVRVRLAGGKTIYERAPRRPRQVVAPGDVGAMNDMLNAALVAGTGKRAALPRHPAAGKTGTSQDFRDAWFVGYTAHLVAGVWIGNDDGRPMNRVMGGSLPARLWHDLMSVAHEGRVPTALPGTVPASPAVEPARGAAAAGLAPDARPQAPREPTGGPIMARAAGEPTGSAPPRAAGSSPGWAARVRELLREVVP